MSQKYMSIIRIVSVKEIRDFFRDPRSIILSIILPLFLFPLLFWVLDEGQDVTVKQNRRFRVAAEAGFESHHFKYDSERINFITIDSESLSDWQNEFDLLLRNDPQSGHPAIIYDNSVPVSIAAYRHLEQLNRQTADLFPEEKKSDIVKPFLPQPIFSPEEAAGKMFLEMILPFMFFIFAITCPLPGSADLSSGEKERGTLEPLISTAAARSGIILGKLIAASFTGICSVCAYMSGIYISYLFIPNIIGDVTMHFSLSIGQIALLSILLIIMTSLFAAIEMFVGFATRSVREAQLLSMPLMMVGMVSVYIAQKLELAHKAWFYIHIPFVNLAIAVREAAIGRMIGSDIAAAFIWTSFYIVLTIYLAINMFQKESSLIKK